MPAPTADWMIERRKPRVVIVGGGFGGLYAARALGSPQRSPRGREWTERAAGILHCTASLTPPPALSVTRITETVHPSSPMPETIQAAPVARPRPVRTPRERRTRGALDLIAAFKFLKAATLIVAGLGALDLVRPSMSARVEEWLENLSLSQGHQFITDWAGRAVNALDSASPHRLELLAVGAFLYATVFLVEGVGLARQRRWAEYLTIAVTLSFMPFEVMALVHRYTLPRLGTLIINGVVVIYLVWQLYSTRHDPHGPAEDAPPARAPAQ